MESKKHKHCDIIKAYADGAKIEVKHAYSNVWMHTKAPLFNPASEYRIKKEKQLVPFTYEDRGKLRDKWLVSKRVNFEIKIVSIAKDITSAGSYQSLLENYTFLDGSPVGKYE